MQMLDGWLEAVQEAAERGGLAASAAPGLPNQDAADDELDAAEEEAELAAAQAARIGSLQRQRRQMQQVCALLPKQVILNEAL